MRGVATSFKLFKFQIVFNLAYEKCNVSKKMLNMPSDYSKLFQKINNNLLRGINENTEKNLQGIILSQT